MKVVATSDTHGIFPQIPECDLLLIAGDVCPVDMSHEVVTQRKWLRTVFGPWLEEQPAEEIVWIGGNHDFVCDQRDFRRIADKLPGHYLCDESIEIGGKLIYGSPWVPNLPNWAFYLRDEDFRRKADEIPDGCDILMLHGPPHGILDGIPYYRRGIIESPPVHEDHVGAPHIASAIQRVLPELVVTGHIHESYGMMQLGEVTFANVAHCDGGYNAVNPPMVFDL